MSNFGVIRDTSGNTVGVTSNALDVHVKDVHIDLVNFYLVNFTGTVSNVNANATAGDTSITVVSDAAFTVGDRVCISEGTLSEHHYPKITAKPGANVLTLDAPLDHSYTTATPATVEIVQNHIETTVGTLAAPISYKIQPPTDEVWHIERLLWVITDGSAMDDSLFGGITALTNGCVIKENKATDRILTIWKSNSSMAEDCYDVTYSSKAPAGQSGLRGRWTLKKADVVIKLDGANSEYLEILVQDDLTGLTAFEMKAQGHIHG